MRRTKPLRVPIEFEELISKVAQDYHRQTGLPPSKAAAMRRMGRKLKGRLVVKGDDFDWRIF